MIEVAVEEVPLAQRVGGPSRARIRGVVADSRRARPGSLFVALPGRRADGHDFLDHARARGAVAALCATDRARAVDGIATLATRDQLGAIGELARLVRRRSRATVVGIAGAAGKTSTKDILRDLCAPHVNTIASEASFNNELGLPLTLFRLEPGTELAVCELGTGARGEVAALSRIARPDVAIVTSVGPEHLESLGSVAEAVRAEAELIESLPRGATVIVSADEPRLRPYRRRDLNQISFGFGRNADVRARRWDRAPGGVDAVLSVLGRNVRVRTNLTSRHQCLNLCAAVAAYAAIGLPLDRIAAGALEVRLSPWRDEAHPLVNGGVVINDAYNANPVSMQASIRALAERRAEGRTVAVLGEMAELGAESVRWHRAIGAEAGALGVDLLIAVGEGARAYLPAVGIETRWAPDPDAARRLLEPLLGPGDAVLLKGSRTAGLERLAEALRA